MAVPAAAAAPVSGPAVNLTVNFATGSADLTPDAVRTLDEPGWRLVQLVSVVPGRIGTSLLDAVMPGWPGVPLMTSLEPVKVAVSYG
jgi:hypothetical protein